MSEDELKEQAMKTDITTGGPILYKTRHKAHKDIDVNESETIIRKMPDDPLCLRASIGGTSKDGYYLVFRGNDNDVERMLERTLYAFREHRKAQ